MRDNVEALKKKPNRKLSLSDIRQENLMPWARNQKTLLSLIKADLHGPNILKATVEGKGTNTRYQIEARNIIKYITIYGPVLERYVRKSHK